MARREFATLPPTPRETGTVVVKTPGGALADISLTEGGSAIGGSTLTVAADGVIPAFWGPPDGADTLVLVMLEHGVDWDATVEASDAAPSTGGSIPVGVPVVRAVPFAFDTPGLVAGHTVHTPTVGDILIDVWIEVVTAWDGTTPTADIGTFVGTDSGLFDYNVGGAAGVDLTQPDGDFSGTGYSFNGDGSPSLVQSYFPGAIQWYNVPAIAEVPSISQHLERAGAAASVPFARTPRMGMGRFIGTNPFKVVVSDNGRTSGNDPGATQGEAILYLVTVTPLTD